MKENNNEIKAGEASISSLDLDSSSSPVIVENKEDDMANPQCEDGYTKIADELFDELIRYNFSGQELRATMFVIRKTYGFNKKRDKISLSQFQRVLSVSKTRASQVVNSLNRKGVLRVKVFINGLPLEYSIVKDYTKWKRVKKKRNSYGKTQSTVKEKRNPPLRKSVTTIDTLTIDTLTIDTLEMFFLHKLNLTVTKKPQLKLLIKTYSVEDINGIISRAAEYWKRENRVRMYRLKKRWNKFYENVNIFLSVSALRERIEDEIKWEAKTLEKEFALPKKNSESLMSTGRGFEQFEEDNRK